MKKNIEIGVIKIDKNNNLVKLNHLIALLIIKQKKLNDR